MNKPNLMWTLNRLQKIFKTGTIAALVIFGVTFLVLFVWEVIAPYTAPMWIVWTLIVVTLFPYLFGGAYFINEFIIKISTKKKNKT